MRGIFAVLIGLSAALAAAEPSGIRCRSEPSEAFLAESETLHVRTKRESPYTIRNESSLLLDAYFHVVTATPNEITEDQLHQQINVLNDNLAPHDIQFKLRGIDWTLNATWANNTYDYWMKMKLHKGDYKTLNVYFISRMNGGGLGAEAGSPEVGCAEPRDTCPDQPGNDPMFNYMDYTGDACYREFTLGQRARMFENFYAYRANV
ncbi:hypothetical protein CEP52_004504 [Fusarium oligoseptatum]|uniref:Metalloprotease 1 n=1 Tax=Fusarium oligoseptatum TaxID=2604345 RepID=A0A428U3A1_9HYPO|nr:hypothetical protein CEP52_004504 [Fusarium oligoseptatum]